MSALARSQIVAAKSSTPTSWANPGWLLQRKCACGSGNATLGGDCAECKRRKRVQAKLAVGTATSTLEAEANRVADQALGGSAGLVPELRPRTSGFAATDSGETAPSSVDQVLVQSGEPLDLALQRDMGQRFGYDFARVRVHADAVAAESAREVNAHAYTVGRDIVFGAGRFAPGTLAGRRLIAHELTHVMQQSHTEGIRGGLEASCVSTPLVQRDGMGDVHLAEWCAELEEQIRNTPAFRGLSADAVRLTNDIIAEIHRRSLPDRYHFLAKLKTLFDTPVKAPGTVAAETRASTATAGVVEKKRKRKEAKRTGVEEAASASAKRSWVAIKGKFGGGTYYVDRTSPTNIVVKADVLLTPKGPGTKADVDAIKAMEDGIEKAASTKGYIVDIRFVDRAAADTFKVDVDPSKPEVATNWSGGDPVGFAHELHHMFAFELDRYNYIEAHATNEFMEIPERLHWFREELKKPANYNDPASIMNEAAHPNDDDACRVAGLDVATCVPARAAARAAKGHRR